MLNPIEPKLGQSLEEWLAKNNPTRHDFLNSSPFWQGWAAVVLVSEQHGWKAYINSYWPLPRHRAEYNRGKQSGLIDVATLRRIERAREARAIKDEGLRQKQADQFGGEGRGPLESEKLDTGQDVHRENET